MTVNKNRSTPSVRRCPLVITSGIGRTRSCRRGSASSPSASAHATTARAFRTAWETGDLAALIGLLDPEVTAFTNEGDLIVPPTSAEHEAGVHQLLAALGS